MLEIDVARPAVEDFRNHGYRVHSEVQTPYGRADIVAVKADEVIVVEAKAKFCFTVIAQAARWTEVATKIFILTPVFRPTKLTSDEWKLLREVMRWKGIGWLELNNGHMRERSQAKVQEKATTELLTRYLVPEQENGVEAGTRGGGYHTTYRGTCNRIAEYVREHPGVSIADVVANVEHHYSSPASARQTLAKCAEKGVIHGVRAERGAEGKIVLYALEATAAE